MRKIIVSAFVLFIVKTSFAQSFDKGNRNFDMKLDFAGYKGTVTDNQTHIVSNSGAAGIVYTPQMTWGTGKKISIGTSLAYSHYLDSSQALSNKPRLNGLDANFIFDFHFVRGLKMDAMAGLKFGIAGVRYNPNDGTGDIYGSMGTVSDIHCSARFYVSEKIGIIASIAFPGYHYGKFGKNTNYTNTIAFRGFSIGTGIAINLTNKKE